VLRDFFRARTSNDKTEEIRQLIFNGVPVFGGFSVLTLAGFTSDIKANNQPASFHILKLYYFLGAILALLDPRSGSVFPVRIQIQGIQIYTYLDPRGHINTFALIRIPTLKITLDFVSKKFALFIGFSEEIDFLRHKEVFVISFILI